MKKFTIVVPALLSALLMAACAGLWLFRELSLPYRGYEGEKYFTVKKGERAAEILDRLFEEKIVRRPFVVKMAYAFFAKKPDLKAGVYLFDRPLSPLEVLGKLRRGEGILVKLTLREGLTLEQSARELASFMGSEEEYLEAMSDPSLIRTVDPRARDLEGYIFPDTYLVAPFTSEKSVVKTIVESFVLWWRGSAAAGQGADTRDTVTLASIVEKETAEGSERPRIAGVFFNRLRAGMPLQSDPTVVFALQRRGLYRGYLLRSDLPFEDPFNTYVVRGLPPGPICSPGKDSILAVLEPEASDYYYFVARGDGSHQFSTSLEMHNRAVNKYIKNGKSKRQR